MYEPWHTLSQHTGVRANYSSFYGRGLKDSLFFQDFPPLIQRRKSRQLNIGFYGFSFSGIHNII